MKKYIIATTIAWIEWNKKQHQRKIKNKGDTRLYCVVVVTSLSVWKRRSRFRVAILLNIILFFSSFGANVTSVAVYRFPFVYTSSSVYEHKLRCEHRTLTAKQKKNKNRPRLTLSNELFYTKRIMEGTHVHTLCGSLCATTTLFSFVCWALQWRLPRRSLSM